MIVLSTYNILLITINGCLQHNFIHGLMCFKACVKGSPINIVLWKTNRSPNLNIPNMPPSLPAKQKYLRKTVSRCWGVGGKKQTKHARYLRVWFCFVFLKEQLYQCLINKPLVLLAYTCLGTLTGTTEHYNLQVY